MNFGQVLATSPVMLLSGPIETRLKYEYGRPSPDGASFVQLFDPVGKAALKSIYRQYMRVAGDYGLPLMVDTPTWRAHPDGLARQGFHAGYLGRIIAEATGLLADLRRELDLESRVFIGGVVGPRFDGYNAAGSPDAALSEIYHRAQVQALAEHGVDFLYAPTFASLDELLGVSMAFAATGLPYILAPVVDAQGYLADGYSLADAVALIDATARPAPLCFAVGCVHPLNFATALCASARPANARIMGVAANGSALPHQLLNGLDHVESDPPEVFADLMVDLHAQGIKILGGCCGTGEAHLRALAEKLVRAQDPCATQGHLR
jgi:S-methylmethionine-dependent homocysteine/selenocysteine methylase